MKNYFYVPSLYYSDGYKPGHKAMLAPGTDYLYGTWIPRSLKHAPIGVDKIMSFGQQLTWRWLHDEYEKNFFNRPLESALEFQKDMSMYLGFEYDADHFIKLHKLGYMPMRVKSLPEGIQTPPNVPHMTFINTKRGFAWFTLYLETIVSSLAWKPAVSSTIAFQLRKTTLDWVRKTDPNNLGLIEYLCHDFSARGLSPWDMISSGLGHATCFVGSDTLAVIPASRYFYGVKNNEMPISSVAASEHSVSTTKIFTVGEKQMLVDWMETFPSNCILSVVMDTMDITKVVKPNSDGILFQLKDNIMQRDGGKLVIRPDSSPPGLSPVEMICGHNNPLSNRELDAYYPEFYHKGLIQCLWETFGGYINDQGYKVLDSHIGAIYGDAITPERQVEIYQKLAANGFASTNIVLGVGSNTYQRNSRDTLGFAAKGSWFEENGNAHNIYKDPVTDSGLKKSLKGMVCVDSEFNVKQECTKEEENEGILQIIYEDGKFFNQTNMTEIRNRIKTLY